MRMFALQNPDYINLYWCSEYGWTDVEICDKFLGTELDLDYCLEIAHKGRWVPVDIENCANYGSWAF